MRSIVSQKHNKRKKMRKYLQDNNNNNNKKKGISWINNDHQVQEENGGDM